MRNIKVNTQIKVLAHVIVGFLFAVNFYHFGDNAAHTLSNASLLFICALYIAYTAMLPMAVQVPAQIPLLKIETFNNWYQLRTYYIASFVISNPMHIIYGLAYSLPMYYFTGQPMELFRFLFFILILYLHGLCGEATGLIVGSLFNAINATFVGAVVLAFLILISGFIVFFNHMHPVFYYLSYTSFVAYTFDGLMHAIYGMGREELLCPAEETFCYFSSPSQLMYEIGNDNFSIGGDIASLVLYIIAAKLVGYFTVSMKLKSNC